MYAFVSSVCMFEYENNVSMSLWCRNDRGSSLKFDRIFTKSNIG